MSYFQIYCLSRQIWYNHILFRYKSCTFIKTLLATLPLTADQYIYINEYLTQKRLALLYKLRVIKKDNPAIGSVYTRNGSIYYKLHSDKNKQYIVNEESELALIKSENNDASQKVTSSKKTTEQLATSSKQ